MTQVNFGTQARRTPLRLAGWVANLVDPHEPYAQAMVDSLRLRIRAPSLGCLPWSPGMDADEAARMLDPPPLGLPQAIAVP